ncbi:MAG: MBL fold metallo-hydrolase [Alistipes sp.]|nr:MBL fold metallo-hydrolase [Alistipes sp.]
MKIACLTFNPIQENTYVVWDDTNECAVIDAGNSTSKENAALDAFIAQHGLKPVLALNTHGHFDHLLGVEHLRRTYGIPFALSGKDAFLIETASVSGTIYGVAIGSMPVQVDINLDERREIAFGRTLLRVIPTPGHTPGHVSLFEPQTQSLFTGDTLFRESIGRTDLPGGDYSWIMRSILDELLPLGDDVRVYPGHGPETTLGHETLYNPFITEVLNQEVGYK